MPVRTKLPPDKITEPLATGATDQGRALLTENHSARLDGQGDRWLDGDHVREHPESVLGPGCVAPDVFDDSDPRLFLADVISSADRPRVAVIVCSAVAQLE